MTQEEKIKEAKRLYEIANADQRYVLESLFPELKEGEDERIRKQLIVLVKSSLAHTDEEINEMIAWLEKQGEQKQDVNMQINPSEYINDMGGNGCYLKNAAQKPAWSEEDEAVLNALIRSLEGEHIYVSPHLAVECLKSLKDRHTWKPSDEQMDAVKSAALDVAKFSSRSEQLRLENEPYYKALVSLYNDLEKLREE